jgi:hypothetical protein
VLLPMTTGPFLSFKGGGMGQGNGTGEDGTAGEGMGALGKQTLDESMGLRWAAGINHG